MHYRFRVVDRNGQYQGTLECVRHTELHRPLGPQWHRQLQREVGGIQLRQHLLHNDHQLVPLHWKDRGRDAHA
jgi:hypothetical protein